MKVGFAGLLSLLTAAVPAAQAPRPETTIKAEFVLRFPEFVQWPSGQDRNPLSVCLSPAHPFGPNVHASADGQARPRRVLVRELKQKESARSCDVVYVAPGDLRLLQEVADLPVLTIGDQPNFCQRGGIINLRVIDGRVRFEIDLSRARRAGLKMDSQLLRLASRVFGGQP